MSPVPLCETSAPSAPLRLARILQSDSLCRARNCYLEVVSRALISSGSDGPQESLVVNLRLRAQLGGFFFGRCVAQKIASADFGTSQILQQVRSSQRRMKLDVEMKPAVIAAVGRRLVQRHHVRERRSPQVVEFRQKMFERFG